MSTEQLRALTVRQPWAFAIAQGFKPVEVRTRRTTYRGPLFIHAGLTRDTKAELVRYSDDAAARLDELGGRGNFWEAAQLVPSQIFAPPATSLALGAIIALVELVDVHEANGCCTPWADPRYGLWHWELRRVRMLTQPVPCLGSLGVWKPDPAVAEQALALAPALVPVEYLVTFDRIGARGGRNGSPAPDPLTIVGIDGDDIASQVGQYALRHLGSQAVEVHVNTELGRGLITTGLHTAGRFTFQPTTPETSTP